MRRWKTESRQSKNMQGEKIERYTLRRGKIRKSAGRENRKIYSKEGKIRKSAGREGKEERMG